jgi:hypothetical protein
MSKYKILLTVKDSTGRQKEINAGTVNINLADLAESDLEKLVQKLDPYLATDTEVATAVDNKSTIKYSDFDIAD